MVIAGNAHEINAHDIPHCAALCVDHRTPAPDDMDFDRRLSADESDDEITALAASGNWLGEVSPIVWDETADPLADSVADGWLWVDTGALEATPGADLARQLADIRVAELDDDALLSAAAAWRRIGSWAKAGELAAVAAFLDRRVAQHPGDSQALDAAMAEVQCALGYLTNTAMAGLASLAEGLCGPLTGTWQALRAGRIDETKAHIIAIGTCVLDADKALLVEQRVLPRAPEQSTGQLRAAVARAVLAVDPAGAERRRRRAETGRRVELRPEGEHTASLAGRDLPIAEALAADQHITAIATAMKAAGDQRSLQYLRGTAYLNLLLGTPPQPPDAHGAPSAPDSPGPDSTGPGSARPPRGTAGPGSPGSGSPGSGSPGSDSPNSDSTGVASGSSGTASDDSFAYGGSGSLHLPEASGSPGMVFGSSGILSGLVPYWRTRVEVHLTVRARDLAAFADHLTVRLPDSTPNRTGGPRQRDHDAPPRQVAEEATNSIRPIRLIVPLQSLCGKADRAGEIPGFGPVPASVARGIADGAAGKRWCYSVLDDRGRVVGHGHIRPRPHDRSEHRLLIDIGRQHRNRGVDPGSAESCECRHGPYRVRGRLRHEIETRDRTCRFPTCRQPAARCDIDHTRPHDLGGPSCPHNLSTLCRRHHAIKQATGWALTQPTPGQLVWTTPSGREYQVHSDEYPH
jgi:hypothetical protein